MPNDLIRFPVMCDSVYAPAEAVSRQDLFLPLRLILLDILVVIEEVRRLLAILRRHRIV